MTSSPLRRTIAQTRRLLRTRDVTHTIAHHPDDEQMRSVVREHWIVRRGDVAYSPTVLGRLALFQINAHGVVDQARYRTIVQQSQWILCVSCRAACPACRNLPSLYKNRHTKFSCCQRFQYGLRVVSNSPQERLRGPRRLAPSLLPVAQRSDIHVKKLREFRLA